MRWSRRCSRGCALAAMPVCGGPGGARGFPSWQQCQPGPGRAQDHGIRPAHGDADGGQVAGDRRARGPLPGRGRGRVRHRRRRGRVAAEQAPGRVSVHQARELPHYDPRGRGIRAAVDLGSGAMVRHRAARPRGAHRGRYRDQRRGKCPARPARRLHSRPPDSAGNVPHFERTDWRGAVNRPAPAPGAQAAVVPGDGEHRQPADEPGHVRFLGCHGTLGPDGKRVSPYAANLASDPDPHRRWDAQYPSLWITHGGGGTFANIWTPSTFAQAGLYISDTSTPGHVYELSAEHHSRTEIKLDQAANWELYALQTEGEREESASASSLEISRSKNITIANYHGYRVTRSYHPVPYAVRIYDSSDIRFRNVHVDNNSAASQCDQSGCRQYTRSSKVPFETCIFDATLHAEVRDSEFAWLDISGKPV